MDAKQLTEARHALYTANRAKWQFFRDAFEAAPDWPAKNNPLSTIGSTQTTAGSSNYISRFSLEDADEYRSRLGRAVCVDLCGPVVDLYAGTVGQPSSVIANIPDEYQVIWDDCDLQGQSFLQLMQTCRAHAAVFGHTFILTDSTKALGEIRTEADRLAQGIRPFLAEITPENMLAWRLDANGTPLEILFQVVTESGTTLMDNPGAESQQTEYRYWSREQWMVFRQSGDTMQLVDQGVNPTGVVPVAVLYHKRSQPFLGESLIKSAAKHQLTLSNWLSAMDRTMQAQAFAQPCLVSESKPSEVGIGVSRVLHLKPGNRENGSEAESFFYASPDSAPLEAMWAAFGRVLAMANKSVGLRADAEETTAAPKSGISRAWEFHDMTRRLNAMVVNEQETARVCFYHVALWMGQKEFPGSISYSNKFNLGSLDESIQTILQLQLAGLPPTARKYLLRDAISKALPAIDPAVEQQIAKELDRLVLAEDQLPGASDDRRSFQGNQ